MSVQDYIKTDQEKIKWIEQKYDLSNDEDVLALFSALQSGEIQFDSPMGREFDDAIYEKATKIKTERRKNAENPSGNTTVKAPEQTEKQKQKRKKVVVLTKKELFFRRIAMGVLLLLAISCLGYFGMYCMEAWKVDRENERLAKLKENETVNDMYQDEVVEAQVGEETKYFKVLEQYKSLYHQNQNLIGWLKIADTIIDYPVMQTGDNEYYQNHNINLEEDRNGALFMDMDCDVRLPSTNYIIYGHNMRSGKMFGSLDQYESESFYKAHKMIEFDTIYEEGTYEVMYVFRSRVYQKDDVVFKYYQFINANSEEEFNSYMSEMAAVSLYDTGVTASYGDQLLTLSTCDYEEEDGRFVVVAKRVE
ncbi:MAG: class B sortase [Lachnospiraceae bacterium]